MPSGRRLIFSSRSFWLKFLGSACLVLLGLLAAGASPLTRPLSTEQITDDKLAVRIHAALANDPFLKKLKLNLLVNVVSKQAIISGPVSDVAIAQHVETVARKVTGIEEVQVRLWVPTIQPTDDPLAKRIAEELQGKRPPPPRNEPKLPEAARPVTPQPKPSPPTQLPRLAVRNPSDIPAPPDRAPEAKPTSQPTPFTVQQNPREALLDPVVPGREKPSSPPAPLYPGAAPLPYKTIPPPNVPTVPESETGLPENPRDMGDTEAEVAPALSKLAQLVLALRKTDPDYNGLVVEVRGGVVMIRGTARDDRIPWAFANKVRTLPGVERVILSTR
jgi:hypothetical protein